MPTKFLLVIVIIMALALAIPFIPGCEGGIQPPPQGASTKDKKDKTDKLASDDMSSDSLDDGEPSILDDEPVDEGPKEPMDTSMLKSYLKGVKAGDWVKYYTPNAIEVREVIGIRGASMKLEVRKYANNGQPIGNPWTTYWNLYVDDDRIMEDIKANEEKGKIDRVDWDFNGKKIKLDVVASRSGADSGGNVDVYSYDVPLEGKVGSYKGSKVAMWLIDMGDSSNKEGMKVKAGDLDKLKESMKEPTDTLVAGYSNLIKQVNMDLRQWDFEAKGSTGDTKATIPEFEIKVIPLEDDAVKKNIDNLKSRIKGLRPGMWCKYLIRQDNIQIWVVDEIKDDKKFHFYRKFYSNLGHLYDTDNAWDDFERFEKEYEQRFDGTYDNEAGTFKVMAGEKDLDCTKYIRRGAGTEVINWEIDEMPINAGRAFSKIRGEVMFYLLDFGDEIDPERMKVNMNDVVKAKQFLKKNLGSQIELEPFHVQQINKWKGERQIYLDNLNAVLERAGKKKMRCSKIHYLIHEDDPDDFVPEDQKPKVRKKKKKKK